MTLLSFLLAFIDFINFVLVPTIFGLAFISFLWGVYTYFFANDADEAKRKKGREFVLYGIIGFFVMLSLWGIVNLLVDSTGLGGVPTPPMPTFGQ